MAGNTGLLKHASNVPQSRWRSKRSLRAGFSTGEFLTLLIGRPRWLGAGRRAGGGDVYRKRRRVAKWPHAAKQIKKTVLELGGSDPFIVMPSADLDEAVQTAGARADQQRAIVHRGEALHRA